MKTLIAIAFGLVLTATAAAAPPVCSPSAPRSCGDWSTWYTTSTSCGFSKVCDGEYHPVVLSVEFDHQKRFRACFLDDGAQCQEVQTQTINLCGC